MSHSIDKMNIFEAKSAFSRDSLLPFGVLISKIMDFKENGLFQENKQNEQISVIPMEFQKRVFYRLLYLSEILPKGTK